MTIQDDELEVSVINPNPIGGQHVGMPHYQVKVLHKSTGIYAVCGEARSQHRNRTIAMSMVEYGLAELGVKP